MRISWRSSRPEEVTEIDADGNPVPSSLTVAEDLALRTAALGVCEYCGGPLTEIWTAGCSRVSVNTVTSAGSPGGSTACIAGSGTVTAGGGGGGNWPPFEPDESESWRFCSEGHMHAFLDLRGQPW